jgi:hypothetical protein
LPAGGNIEQADGTDWMARFSQNMAKIAAELNDPLCSLPPSMPCRHAA